MNGITVRSQYRRKDRTPPTTHPTAAAGDRDTEES